ncbi:melanoma-associated antigen B2-like isoform X1 [Bos javanicus]|uniref:melanoma-associated antigen B2-like isoform X1 n=1 Tax=Bos javanicus TaxID=9906 RepID=UPI002AA7F5C6|nr:melanoma-associated antigen B2-like isoform X1 [Bos javanicus]
MPRGQKSKHRAREKRRQARAEIQGLHDQATTSRGEETTSFSPPDSESAPSSSCAAGTTTGPPGAQGTTSAAAGAIRKRSGGGGAARSRSGVGGIARLKSGGGAEGQVQGGENSSQASAAAESSHTDLLTMESENLVKYMLLKYKMRELIKRSEMVKVIHRRYKAQFPEILSRASEHMEMVFGLVLKEVRRNSHCYTLVSNLDLSDSESMRGDWGLPKNGLLMPLLGVIYLNGHRASEEEVWKFLNILGIYDGRMHFIFGDTRKLITEDLVQEEYLEYNQVPGSDPPRYEFLWGPKALTENSKTKVLQFLTKVNNLVPDALLPHYEEALREEAERTGARAATGTGPSASASADPSASARPGTSAAARAGTSASARADMSALAGAGPSASARDGTSAAARDGTSASTSAHSRATSSRSSGP